MSKFCLRLYMLTTRCIAYIYLHHRLQLWSGHTICAGPHPKTAGNLLKEYKESHHKPIYPLVFHMVPFLTLQATDSPVCLQNRTTPAVHPVLLWLNRNLLASLLPLWLYSLTANFPAKNEIIAENCKNSLKNSRYFKVPVHYTILVTVIHWF